MSFLCEGIGKTPAKLVQVYQEEVIAAAAKGVPTLAEAILGDSACGCKPGILQAV